MQQHLIKPSRMELESTFSSVETAMVSGGGGLQDLYGCIADEMQDVESQLQTALQNRYEALRPIFDHSALLGGKRLRPALALLAGRAAGSLTGDHVILGTVIEMIHTATLIHDDVLDGADQRRHVATINAKWDSHTSILLGDYLFAKAFSLSASIGDTRVCQEIGEASMGVCEGELRQCNQRDCLSLVEDDYIDILRGKTAELCRVSCELGARLAGASPEIQSALAAYGENLGIAFQITDDWLDVWGETDQVGKTLGTDLAQGKMTLPLR